MRLSADRDQTSATVATAAALQMQHSGFAILAHARQGAAKLSQSAQREGQSLKKCAGLQGQPEPARDKQGLVASCIGSDGDRTRNAGRQKKKQRQEEHAFFFLPSPGFHAAPFVSPPCAQGRTALSLKVCSCPHNGTGSLLWHPRTLPFLPRFPVFGFASCTGTSACTPWHGRPRVAVCAVKAGGSGRGAEV